MLNRYPSNEVELENYAIIYNRLRLRNAVEWANTCRHRLKAGQMKNRSNLYYSKSDISQYTKESRNQTANPPVATKRIMSRRIFDKTIQEGTFL